MPAKRARKSASKQPSKAALAGRLACVAVERNGATIRMDDVPAEHAGIILGDLLTVFRLLTKQYPELVVTLDAIGGGSSATDVRDDGDWESREPREKHIGFMHVR